MMGAVTLNRRIARYRGRHARVAGRFLVGSDDFVSKAPSRNQASPERPSEGNKRDDSLAHGVFADLLPHLWRFRSQFREGRDAEKALRAALRLGLDFFGAQEGCVATVRPGSEEATISYPVPADGWWDRTMLAGFLRGDKVRVPPELMLARIRRHGRMWGRSRFARPAAITTGISGRHSRRSARSPMS